MTDPLEIGLVIGKQRLYVMDHQGEIILPFHQFPKQVEEIFPVIIMQAIRDKTVLKRPIADQDTGPVKLVQGIQDPVDLILPVGTDQEVLFQSVAQKILPSA